MRLAALTLLPLAVAAAGCAARRPAPRAAAALPTAEAPPPGRSEAELRRAFAGSTKREPYVTMLTQEQAHEAMPNIFKGVDMPTLVLAAGHMPKSMEAVLNVARTARHEGPLDNAFLNDVFWAVSSANDCFY